MKYSGKVKKSKAILDKLYSLKDQEELTIQFGKDYKGEPREFKIKCYENYKGDGFHYSIWESKGLNGMNIESIGRTTMKGYTYDMMSQRTTYNFPLYEMEIVEESK